MNELCAGSKYNFLARRKFIILGVRYCVDGYESVHSRVRSGHDKCTNWSQAKSALTLFKRGDEKEKDRMCGK